MRIFDTFDNLIFSKVSRYFRALVSAKITRTSKRERACHTDGNIFSRRAQQISPAHGHDPAVLIRVGQTAK